MEPAWVFYTIFLAGVAAEGFLVWLIWPPATYRTADRWARSEPSGRCSHWVQYRTIKRSLTPLSIAMNAIQAPSFTEEDLSKLNELFNKLGQRPAEVIAPGVGDNFERSIMTDLETDSSDRDSHFYVLKLNTIGVSWRGETLRKAEVTKCTPDRLMMHKLAIAATSHGGVARSFLDFIEQNSQLPPDFELHTSMVKGFIDTKISEQQAGSLFSVLQECHPESDFALILPTQEHCYDDDTMIAAGGHPGHICKVVEVVHPGLKRNSDRAWRVKALVTIRNISRNEKEK